MSEGDHCHVIYEDRNKYREYVCSLRGPKVNTRQEIQHNTVYNTESITHEVKINGINDQCIFCVVW